MTPAQPRKAQILQDLEVAEISLCDQPSNALTDPRTGWKIPLSRVALYKRDSDADTAEARLRQLRKLSTREVFAEVGKLQRRKDDPGSQDVSVPNASLQLPLPQLQANQLKQDRKKKKKEKEMAFKKIIKSATSRDQVVEAVQKRAQRIAKRKGISAEEAEGKVWRKRPEVQQAYEDAGTGSPKRAQPKMFQVTKAEQELDRRARKRMTKTGESYPAAVASALSEDPGLYDSYEKELAAGATYLVPQPDLLTTQPGDYDRMVNKYDDDGLECPECDADVDEDDKFCANCGADLSKEKSKRRKDS